MTKTQKTLSLMLILGSVVLTACQNQSNTIQFNTPAPTATFNTHNQTALVNVETRDLRTSAEVAQYTSNGNIHRINALPQVTSLFQQAVQQDLNSKGFTLVQGASNANVMVNIKHFFADVTQGNLRYKITANIEVDLVVQGARGQFTKNFATSRTYEGAFGARNKEIEKVLGDAYRDLIMSIYHDNEVSYAIHQLK